MALPFSGSLRLPRVRHSPALPGDGDPVTVTATVTPRLGSLSAVNLVYRVMYGSEFTLPMSDSGAGLFDNLNVPEAVNYLAAHDIVQDTDDTRKNF